MLSYSSEKNGSVDADRRLTVLYSNRVVFEVDGSEVDVGVGVVSTGAFMGTSNPVTGKFPGFSPSNTTLHGNIPISEHFQSDLKIIFCRLWPTNVLRIDRYIPIANQLVISCAINAAIYFIAAFVVFFLNFIAHDTTP